MQGAEQEPSFNFFRRYFLHFSTTNGVKNSNVFFLLLLFFLFIFINFIILFFSIFYYYYYYYYYYYFYFFRCQEYIYFFLASRTHIHSCQTQSYFRSQLKASTLLGFYFFPKMFRKGMFIVCLAYFRGYLSFLCFEF